MKQIPNNGDDRHNDVVMFRNLFISDCFIVCVRQMKFIICSEVPVSDLVDIIVTQSIRGEFALFWSVTDITFIYILQLLVFLIKDRFNKI